MEAIALMAYVWIGYGFFGYMYKKNSHVDMKFIDQILAAHVQERLPVCFMELDSGCLHLLTHGPFILNGVEQARWDWLLLSR